MKNHSPKINTRPRYSKTEQILLDENKRQRAEIDSLKKSLKVSQNELEKLRTANHQLDKDKSILDYRLTTAFLPEFLKFLASSVGAGVAVSLFFNNQFGWAIFCLVVSIIIYGGLLWLYKK